MLEDMDRPGFFKQYYGAVRNTVTNEQLQQFAKLGTDEEKLRFCFENIPAIHEIEIRTFYHGKSERDALERKEAGNKAFGRKKNMEALRCYSQAVVKAPVLSGKYWKLVKENADPRKMTLYPICLANRSAALYQLNDYYYCVKDIDEALEHHYPKELKYKLYKRKARILVDLKRYLEARDSFRQAIKWLDWARLDRDKRMEVQKDIQKWLSIFESGKVVKNADGATVNLFPPVPPLSGGAHPVFPSLSNKVEMRYSPTQGRYVVAAEDIKVGDVVCAEKPYAAVLLWEEFGTHCQNCFLVTRAPIPCTTCSGAVFCSSDCRDNAYFHKVECTVQDLLQGSGMSINCFLAFRMLSQTPLAFFVKNSDRLKLDEDPESVLRLKPSTGAGDDPNANAVPASDSVDMPTAPLSPATLNDNSTDPNSNLDKERNINEQIGNGSEEDSDKENKVIKLKDLTEEEKQKLIEEEEKQRAKLEEQRLQAEEHEYQKARKRIEEARRKKLEEQKLKEEMFWRIYHLVRHSENRTVEDFLHRTVMACFMVKTLKKTKYFDEFKGTGVAGNAMKLSDFEALAGGLLLRFLQIIQFNAHEVSEFCLAAPKTFDGCKNASLGAAIYPTLAYFNHSCNSAQVRYFSGNSVITRAVRPIAKGEVVPENYGPCYTTKSKSDRRLQLVDRYWFECQCEACTEDWPTFANMDMTRLKFRCHRCQHPLLVPVDGVNPLHKCVNCGEQTNILSALKDLQMSEKTFQAATAELDAFNIPKAEALFKQNLEELSGALCPPYKDYHISQEAFMKCVLYSGNVRVKKNMADASEDK